jgi:hypothetical protein
MPTFTTTISAANLTRIVAAADEFLEREAGETDGQIAKRWNKLLLQEGVQRAEKRFAKRGVQADPTLVEIT